MKLDHDIVREVLLAVEASDRPPLGWIRLDLPDRPSELVSYHVELLAEAGFIQAHKLSDMSHYEWQPRRLTYQGHEFLDSVRDPEIWRRTKQGAATVGGGGLQLLFQIAKAVGVQVLKERLGLDLG